MSAAGPNADAGRADRLAHALAYADLDLKVFPLRVRVQENERGELEKKLFPVLDWPNVATSDPAKVESWWGEGKPWSTASIGIATAQSGISVVDLDGPEGLAEWRRICDTYGIDEDVPRYSTPGGGEHWWYRTDPDRPLPTGARTIGEHIDTRGGYGPKGTGLVIVPPSIDDRGSYDWITDLRRVSIMSTPPEAAYALIEQRRGIKPRDTELDDRQVGGDGSRVFTLAQAQVFIRPAIDALRTAAPGERNHRLNTAARMVAHFGGEFWSREQAQARLTQLAQDIGLGDDEIDKTIESAYRAQAQAYASGAIDDYGRPVGWSATYAEPSPLGDDEGAADATPDPFEDDVAREVRRMAVREEAQRRLRAEIGSDLFVESELHRLQVREAAQRQLDVANLPDLAVLDAEEFLGAAMPEWLVRGFLYRASTAKVYGPPGGTKSFFLLDIALHLATGKQWQGRNLPRTTVHYVMAEGQAVNTLRARGWLAHHGIDEAELKGWLTAIPQGILLTPEGIERYLQVVEKQQPGLVILDTKNRMMVGEENSASDVAVMVRAMDAIREISGACVCLVDHTGILDQSRGRGSNAVTAAMDSEVRVGVDGIVATAEVTRDKAGVTGEKIGYRLVTVEDVETPEGIRKPAVCEPVDAAAPAPNPAAEEAWQEWRNPALWPLPADVLELSNSGTGKKAIPDVARYMRHFAGNQDTAGRARNEMCRDLLRLGTYTDDTVLRAAWDRLLDSERIWNIQTKSRTAATHWMARPSDPAPATREDGHAPDHETP